MHVYNLLNIAFTLLLGGFLPGYFLHGRFRSRETLLISVLISVACLFQAIFWCGLIFDRLNVHHIQALLLVLSTGAAFLIRNRPIRGNPSVSDVSVSKNEKILITGMAAAILVVFGIRAYCHPLTGGDTYFRWEFLAIQMERYGAFDFYPPRTAEDFTLYFYPDGIPPLASFLYWWIYAGLGIADPRATAPIIWIQFALILMLACKLGDLWASGRTGLLAMGIAGCSPLLFWSVLMGQETGLTALFLGAMIYFLKSGDEMDRAVLAGISAGLGALCREYGCIYPVLGIVAMHYWRHSRRNILSFVLVSLAVAGPWYVRNWVLTGNPFYSNPVGDFFAVNPVHLEILKVYDAHFGWNSNTGEKLREALSALFLFSPVHVILGPVCFIWFFRKDRVIPIVSLVMLCLWIYSVGFTSGGILYSMRVLSPVILVLSIVIALTVEEISSRFQNPGFVRQKVSLLLAGAMAWSLWVDIFVPLKPRFELAGKFLLARTTPNMVRSEMNARLAAGLRKYSTRILSDDAYLHSGFSAHGIDVVPVWSPEVSFLFDTSKTAGEIAGLLKEKNIGIMTVSPGSLNFKYLVRSPLLAAGPARHKRVGELGDTHFYLIRSED